MEQVQNHNQNKKVKELEKTVKHVCELVKNRDISYAGVVHIQNEYFRSCQARLNTPLTD